MRKNTKARPALIALLGTLLLVLVAVTALVGVYVYQEATTVRSSQNSTPNSGAGLRAGEDSPPGDVAPINSRDNELQQALQATVTDLSRTHEAYVGIAVMGEGGPLFAGNLDNRAAWSTIKVPIAAAAQEKAEAGTERSDLTEPPDLTGLINATIQDSDNDAALELWSYLGDGSDELAAEALQDYLARTGDPIEVPYEYEAGVFEGFGDIPWRATNQVEFLANFPCAPGAAPVLAAMRRINPEHSHGLGTLPGARFKGGWGEEFDGTFLYRQMGLIPVTTGGAQGYVPVAIIAIPAESTESTENTEAAALDVVDAAAAELTSLLPRTTRVATCG